MTHVSVPDLAAGSQLGFFAFLVFVCCWVVFSGLADALRAYYDYRLRKTALVAHEARKLNAALLDRIAQLEAQQAPLQPDSGVLLLEYKPAL